MWKYEQSSGKFSNPEGEVIATGYAGGNGGKNPEGVNNPELQNVKKVGPLPKGKYTLGTPVEGSHLGRFAIPLIPDKDNEMFSRGDFYIHGDNAHNNKSASEGCIILPFAIRHTCYDSKDHELGVI